MLKKIHFFFVFFFFTCIARVCPPPALFAPMQRGFPCKEQTRDAGTGSAHSDGKQKWVEMLTHLDTSKRICISVCIHTHIHNLTTEHT